MPRGQADYGALAAKEVSASVSDMGEVAARLGSIVTYDKRGDVVDFDNFEEPVLKWESYLVGTGSYVRLSSEAAKSGSQSIKLYVGNIADAVAQIFNGISVLGSKRLGIEYSFSTPSSASSLYSIFSYWTGSKVYVSGVKFDFGTYKLSILDNTYAWQEVKTFGGFWNRAYVFHTIKLVVDFETGMYVRLLFDSDGYDISTTSLYSISSFNAPTIIRTINLASVSAVGGIAYIDDFVFTQAEP